MPACPASFFTIPNKSEGFSMRVSAESRSDPTSGNDILAIVNTIINTLIKILKNSIYNIQQICPSGDYNFVFSIISESLAIIQSQCKENYMVIIIPCSNYFIIIINKAI